MLLQQNQWLKIYASIKKLLKIKLRTRVLILSLVCIVYILISQVNIIELLGNLPKGTENDDFIKNIHTLKYHR